MLLTFPFVIEIRFGWPLSFEIPPCNLASLSCLCLHYRCGARASQDRLRWRIRGGFRDIRGPQRVSRLRGSLHLRLRLRLQPHVSCQAPAEARGREETQQPGGDKQAAVPAGRHENTRKLHFPPDSVPHPGGAALKVCVTFLIEYDLFWRSFLSPSEMPHSTFAIFPWELCDKISYFFKLSTALITFWMIMMCRKEFLGTTSGRENSLFIQVMQQIFS